MPARESGTRRAIALVAYLVVLVSVCVWTALGGSMLLLILVVAIPAALVARTRLPLTAALALLLVVLTWTTLGVFVFARYSRIPALLLFLSLAVAVGATCAWLLHRRGLRPLRQDLVELGFAGFGGIVWCAVLLVAVILPGGTPVSWAMTGDAANNVLFARTLLEQGGVSLGIGQNPVPLTAAMIGLFMLPGTLLSGPGVASQIIALTEMWSFGIVGACVMCGALALSLTVRRTALAYLAAALSSALPLGWFMLSGPVVLGFVNFHLTLALLVASLISLVHARRAVLTSLVTISLSLGAVLALWAPLAGIPGIALVVLLVVHRRRVLELRRGRLAIALVALAQPLALFVTLSIPSLIGQGGALQESLGAVFEFKKFTLAIVLALAVLFGLLLARTTRSMDSVWVLVSVVGGGGVCLAALLWLRRNEVDIWNYYQLKFLWFYMAMVLIVGVVAGLAYAATIGERAAIAALSVVVVLATSYGVSEYGRATVPTFNRDAQAVQSPLARIIAGDFFSVGEGDRVFHRVVELMSADEKSILWESTDPDEDSIMFWVVQMSASSVEDVDLRRYAYYHDGQSMDDLCTVRKLIGAPVTLVTADPEIARRAEEACGDLGPVRLEQ